MNENSYADGGIGGIKNLQGNTPITPLIKEENCTHIIVNHLSDGSLWNRNDFNDATILEIRPKKTIKRRGLVGDLLEFDADSINAWIGQGYEDTQRCFEELSSVFLGFSLSAEAKRIRNISILRLMNDGLSSQSS